MPRFRCVLPTLVTALLVLSACGDDSTGSDITLESAKNPDGKAFDLQGTSNIVVPQGVALRFAFTETAIAVSGGCNEMNGVYVIENNRLVVDQLAQTERACDAPLMDVDREVAAFLMTKPAFVYAGNTVVLTSGEKALTMVEAVPVVDAPLEGTTWKVTGTFEGDATQSLDTEPATIVFDGGTAQVFAGCNNGSVTYELDGNRITFGALALTKKACDEAAMKMEATVSAVLAGEKEFDIFGPKLTITDPAGSSTLLKGLDLVAV
jgi:heat shock protein HslJ